MENVSVNIENFEDHFYAVYELLYDTNDNIAGYTEAVNAFDTMLNSNKSFKRFVGDFVRHRGDLISSDREAAAFMFALDDLGAI